MEQGGRFQISVCRVGNVETGAVFSRKGACLLRISEVCRLETGAFFGRYELPDPRTRFEDDAPFPGIRLMERGVSGIWNLMGVYEMINESDLALNEGRFVRKFEGFM
jgi:hypothetical protein